MASNNNPSKLPDPPQSRHDFRVAIICALPLEAEKVQMVFDRNWTEEGMKFGKVLGDHNTYTTGSIGRHNVVLAYMPGMGVNCAASVASGVCASFASIAIILVVGICGAVPFHPVTGEEIILGDCMISTSVIQYDYGRRYPGKFVSKDTPEDRLGRAPPMIRSLLASLQVKRNHDHLMQRQLFHLGRLHKSYPVKYPGIEKDRLFESSYLHTHHLPGQNCSKCLGKIGVCTKDCDEIGCDLKHQVKRTRLQNTPEPAPKVYFGCFGSANTVMRSGEDRDLIAQKDNLIAFEMEGSGVWDTSPTIIIKSACDYADCHKNKEWQDYAAATAATGMKALLEKLELPDRETSIQDSLHLSKAYTKTSTTTAVRMLPFTKDKDFVGRQDILDKLLKTFKNQQSTYQTRAALVGMGGVGKSQIAIELAYRIIMLKPQHSVFWIHASTIAEFEQGYREIATQANIPLSAEAGVLGTVHRWLSNDANGSWHLILDNVDSNKIFTTCRKDGRTLRDFIPVVSHGSILITSRDQLAAANLVENNPVYIVEPMIAEDSLSLLKTRLTLEDSDKLAAEELVQTLEHLPLAIVHAGAYIQMRKPAMNVYKYVNLLKNEHNQARLLDASALVDIRRKSSTNHAVTVTLQISFQAIKEDAPQAANLLSQMCMFENHSIPRELIYDKNHGEQTTDDDEYNFDFEDNIALLVRYSLIKIEADGTSYKIHRLVQLSVTRWLKEHEQLPLFQIGSLRAMAQQFPSGKYKTWATCRRLLPHARKVVDYKPDSTIVAQSVRLMRHIGWYLNEVGKDHDAEQVLLSAQKLVQARLGPGHPEMLRVSTLLAKVLHALNRYADAERILRTTLATYEPLHLEDEASLYTQYWLGITLERQGKVKEAKSLLTEYHLRSKVMFGTQHHITINFLGSLEGIAKSQESYQVADGLQTRVLERTMRIHGQSHPGTHEQRHHLALVLQQEGKLERAEAMYKDLLAEHDHDEDDLSAITTLHHLGGVLYEQKRYEEAETLLQQALATGQGILVKDHPKLLDIAARLCDSQEKQGKWAMATETRHEIAAKGEKILASGATKRHNALGALGRNLYHDEKFSEAGRILRKVFNTEQAKDKWENSSDMVESNDRGRANPSTTLRLTRSLRKSKRLVEAENLLREALESKELCPQSPEADVSLFFELGRNLYEQRRWEESGAYFRNIDESGGRGYGEAQLANLWNLVRSLFKQDQYFEAEPYLHRILAIQGSRASSADADRLKTLHMLGVALSKQGRDSEAEFYLHEVLEIQEGQEATDTGGSEILETLYTIGTLLFKQGRYLDAESYLRRILIKHSDKEEHSEGDSAVLGTLHTLGMCLFKQGHYIAAEPYLRRALKVQATTKRDSEGGDNMIETAHMLGIVLFEQQRYFEAEEFFKAVMYAVRDGAKIHETYNPEQWLAKTLKETALGKSISDTLNSGNRQLLNSISGISKADADNSEAKDSLNQKLVVPAQDTISMHESYKSSRQKTVTNADTKEKWYQRVLKGKLARNSVNL